MAWWGRVIVRVADVIRGGWGGAQVLAFVLFTLGYRSTVCEIWINDVTWFDVAAIEYLRAVTFPLTFLAIWLYFPSVPLVEFFNLVAPALTGPFISAVDLATNYQLGALLLTLLKVPGRWMTAVPQSHV